MKDYGKIITCRVSTETFAAIEEEAKKNGLKIGTITADILSEWAKETSEKLPEEKTGAYNGKN